MKTHVLLFQLPRIPHYEKSWSWLQSTLFFTSNVMLSPWLLSRLYKLDRFDILLLQHACRFKNFKAAQHCIGRVPFEKPLKWEAEWVKLVFLEEFVNWGLILDGSDHTADLYHVLYRLASLHAAMNIAYAPEHSRWLVGLFIHMYYLLKVVSVAGVAAQSRATIRPGPSFLICMLLYVAPMILTSLLYHFLSRHFLAMIW